MRSMQLSDFSYHLPPELIAQEPISPRDHARLMLVNRATQEISHHHIYDLPQLLPPDYFLVANNTKVFPARLRGIKETGGKVEILLLHPLGNSRYQCIAKPGIGQGTRLIFASSLTALVIKSIPSKMERVIKFNLPESELRTKLSELGEMPTPPYIKKMLANRADYQTIYAKYGFSAAAPTAGLHFTRPLLSTLKADHSWLELTLDVGLGTFLPVKVHDVTTHHMHSENFTLTRTVASRINRLHKHQKLLSVGTTTTRALESSVGRGRELIPQSQATDIFLYPPYRFREVDALLTNFHLPESTLLMLVSAFVSSPNTEELFISFPKSLIGRAYHEAINKRYRFFSFGDAMLIL